MKTLITWERQKPDTDNGESIKVTYTYSSFDKQEIDDFEMNLKKNVGTMIILDGDKING